MSAASVSTYASVSSRLRVGASVEASAMVGGFIVIVSRFVVGVVTVDPRRYLSVTHGHDPATEVPTKRAEVSANCRDFPLGLPVTTG